MNNNLGFSIKSQLGGDSTLLNASGATNFTYKVVGADFSDEEIENINAIATRTKIIDRVDAVRRKGAELQFDHVDNSIFRSNLAMMDNGLAPTIAQLLVEQFNTGKEHSPTLSSHWPKVIPSALIWMTRRMCIYTN